MTPWLDSVVDLARKSGPDRGSVEEMISRLSKNSDIKTSFFDASIVAQLAGVQLESRRIIRTFSLDPTNPFTLRPTEAIENYKSSKNYSEKIFQALLRECEEKARTANDDLLSELKTRLQDLTVSALDEGLNYSEFADKIVESVARQYGVDAEEGGYLAMAFRTNVNTAYSSGRYAQIDEVRAQYPYWQYLTVGDGAVRPEHAVLDMVVFALNSATERLMPPLSYNCRCDFVALPESPEGAIIYTDVANFVGSIDPDFSW